MENIQSVNRSPIVFTSYLALLLLPTIAFFFVFERITVFQIGIRFDIFLFFSEVSAQLLFFLLVFYFAKLQRIELAHINGLILAGRISTILTLCGTLLYAIALHYLEFSIEIFELVGLLVGAMVVASHSRLLARSTRCFFTSEEEETHIISPILLQFLFCLLAVSITFVIWSFCSVAQIIALLVVQNLLVLLITYNINPTNV